MPELRRLLALLDAAEQRRERGLAWSDWRRQHQAHAALCHHARRAQIQGDVVRIVPAPTMRDVLPEPTEQQWEAMLALLAIADRAAHRPPLPHRPILAGIFWVLRTNRRFCDIPPEYGASKTIESRYRRWQQRGIWAQLLAILRPPAAEPGTT